MKIKYYLKHTVQRAISVKTGRSFLLPKTERRAINGEIERKTREELITEIKENKKKIRQYQNREKKSKTVVFF